MESPVPTGNVVRGNRPVANRYRFGAFGFCFGLSFVAVALVIEWSGAGWRGSAIDLAVGSPSLWVVATAPLVLGAVFHLLGKKHDDIGDALQRAEIAATANAILATENRQYRRLVDEVRDYAIYLMDASGIVTSWNRGAQMIKGYKSEDIIGRNFSTFYTPEDRLADLPRKALHTARAEGRFAGEGWLLKENGDRLWASVVIDPVYDDDQFIGFVKITRDMTAQHTTDLELREALHRAECANVAKREFLANMSHELRTPLNGIIGLASVLASSELASPHQSMVELIGRSGDHLKELVEDIIDISRIDSGRMEMKIERVRMSDLLDEVEEQFRGPAASKGLEWSVELAADADGMFDIPSLRLKQILINLVANAVKFTDRGAVTLQVDRAGPGDVGSHRFRVIDTGPGIPETKLEAVFERFEQVDGSNTRRFDGSGLGLAISRELATLLGGTLEASSVCGRGSTFTLTAPLQRSSDQTQNEPGVPSPRGADALASDALRILAADDHSTNRTMLATIFASAGVDIVTVENGQEAVDAAEVETFSAILMDIQMPVMDGLTAIRRIREREMSTGRGRTPIIVLTANVLPEHVAASLAAGADDHVGKPITAPALLEAISLAINGDVDGSSRALSA